MQLWVSSALLPLVVRQSPFSDPCRRAFRRKARASLPMATAVKTLDALHLASALLWRERRNSDLGFATHDPHQARAARALGFDCVGV